MEEDEKVEAEIKRLQAEEHTVVVEADDLKGYTRRYRVDDRMKLSREQMLDLFDGVYTLAELERRLKRQRDEEGSV